MKGALNEKTFGAIEAPAEELDHVLAHQERRKCASRAEYGLARREPVAAQHLIDIRLPEHRVLEPARDSWTGSPVSAVRDGASLGDISETGVAIIPLTTAGLGSAQAGHQRSVPSQRLRRVPSPGVVLCAYQTRARELL